jgi:hypothetical protein
MTYLLITFNNLQGATPKHYICVGKIPDWKIPRWILRRFSGTSGKVFEVPISGSSRTPAHLVIITQGRNLEGILNREGFPPKVESQELKTQSEGLHIRHLIFNLFKDFCSTEL